MNKQPTDWVLANDHASTPLVSLVYDATDRNMIVAAVCSFTSATVFTALKAQLEKNNSGAYSMKAIPERGEPKALTAAGRGYVTDKQTFDQFHARAFAASFLNKKAGDPRFFPGAQFYVLPLGNESVEDLFIERLIAAIPLPIQREWKQYLLSAGKAKKLVSNLATLGDPGLFPSPLRVSVSGWEDVITDGLRHKLIQFVE